MKSKIYLQIIVLSFGILSIQNSFGQNKERSDNTLWGLNYGVNVFSRTSLEIGYGFITSALYHKGKKSVIWDRSVLIVGDLSTEFQFGHNLLIGPKISTRCSFELWDWEFNYFGFIFGADYIAYNDFKTVNSVFRPSIGIHYFLDVFELTYGYNFRLDNNSELPLNTHVIELRIKPFIFIKSMKQAWGGP